MGSTRNMLASLGLRWWQHMIIRGVHEHCTAAEVTGPRNAVLTPSIRLCPSDPAISFKLYRIRFQLKITFAKTISNAQVQTLKRVGIKAQTSVFPNGQNYATFSRPSSFNNVAAAIIEGRRQRIKNDSLVTSDVYPEGL